MEEFSKPCPKCKKKQVYSCKSSLIHAKRKNKICVSCTVEKSKMYHGDFKRICKCGKELKYSCRQSLNLAKKRNGMCRTCATKDYDIISGKDVV